MWASPSAAAIVTLAFLLAAPDVRAQHPETPPSAADSARVAESLDVWLLRTVYDTDAPAVVVPLQIVNATAYPVFRGAAPVALGVGLVRGESVRPGLRLALAEAGTAALTMGVKAVARRPRPYRRVPGITPRDHEHEQSPVRDPNSFPSGHAALAFTIATSASLSAGHWVVTVPALTWASLAATSRVWHGVHYPSDVLAGAALGAGTAAVVHWLLPDAESGAPVVVSVSVTL